MATHEEWAEVLGRAWDDEDFKNLLEHDPAAAFRECGIEPGRIIHVMPHPDDMSDEQLDATQPNQDGMQLSVLALCGIV